MAQVRFQIGVPRAGSAARDAESSQERFRSLRPEAGSAARQAEEERRATGAPLRPRSARVQVQTQRGQTSDSFARSGTDQGPAKCAQKFDETSQLSAARATYPDDAPRVIGNTGAASSGGEALSGALPKLNPLQTAAAKVRSLFRSVVPRAEGEN